MGHQYPPRCCCAKLLFEQLTKVCLPVGINECNSCSYRVGIKVTSLDEPSNVEPDPTQLHNAIF